MKNNCLMFFLLLAITNIAAAATLQVPNYYPTIQDAVDAAYDGDTIIVADGNYTGIGNRDIDLQGKTLTLHSENGPENCIIDCDGSEAEPHRGFYLHSSEKEKTTIMGFTIKNGYGLPDGGALQITNNSSAYILNCTLTSNSGKFGGAVLCKNGSVRIENCQITNNKSYINGGGIYCQNGDLDVSSSFIKNNTTTNNGGGIYCRSSDASVSDCIINANVSKAGGGIGTYESSVSLVECWITGNSAEKGGGVSCSGSSSVEIQYCTIVGNSSRYAGGLACRDTELKLMETIVTGNYANESDGGLNLSGQTAKISKCIISGNKAGHSAGGLSWNGSELILTNCVISGNSAKYTAGGLRSINKSSMEIRNSTIAHNSAQEGGGIYCTQSASASVRNSIIWSNSRDQIKLTSNGSNHADVNYSNIQGGWDGKGNINAEPQFFMYSQDRVEGKWSADPNYLKEDNITLLTDANASFVENEFVGRFIQTGIENQQVFVVANTTNVLEVFGNLANKTEKGDTYLIVDYNLMPGSPCVNAGSSETNITDDLDGNQRDLQSDMGAYESGF